MLHKRRLLLLLLQVIVRLMSHVVGSPCHGGSNIFSTIAENSPMGQFIANISITAHPGSLGLRLCLEGPNADWMFLDGRTIRLNSSHSRVLDREVQGSQLIAQLICQDNAVQKHYRIRVQILNENDNKPEFSRESTKAVTISELAAVNTIVFTVKAMDADGDMIRYTIDPGTLDSSYFRIDVSNSGSVVLDKPLDYETRTNLTLLIWAMEINTREMFNASTSVAITVQDGDDQYPHFLPCVLLSPDLPVCINPSYSANITVKQQNLVLEFSPGPIQAEDGDHGLDSPLLYSIISGSDHGRFEINSSTGHITLTRAVMDQRQTPFFRLSIMASQLDDPSKYSITSVLVRVQMKNMFPLIFNQSIYRGFVVQSSSPAAIVSTYGNQVLLVQVSDLDFPDELNPNVQYSLFSPSATEGLFHITQRGVLIARTDRLHAFDRQVIQVIARDEESGEEVSASVDIEVLQRGQAVPRGTFTEEQLFQGVKIHLTGVISAAILLLLLIAALFLLLRIIRKKQSLQELEGESHAKAEREAIVVTSHPALSGEQSRSGSRHGQHGLYTRKQSMLPLLTLSSIEAGNDESSTTILLSATERSEGNVPGAFTPRATVADWSGPQGAQHFTLTYSSHDMLSHSTRKHTHESYNTMVSGVCVESEDNECV